MNKNLTELVFILDRSGSMCGLEADTIGGFNAMLEKQKAGPGQALVTTLLFDTDCRLLHDRLPLAQVPAMTGRDYTVGGCTALLDALGGAICKIGDIHKYAREEDRPARTVFVITTDGMENASHRYTLPEVKRLVERQKQRYDWEFLFLGANIDAVATAGKMGIGADRAVNYCCDGAGTQLNYQTVSDGISAMRCGAPLGADWSAPIAQDFAKRGGRK